MTISVRTTARDGSGSQWLDQIGQVQGWKHTLTFPGGPSAASFNFGAPFLLEHPALAPGRLLYAYSGCALVWAGRLEQPKRGQPWQCTCTGIAAFAKDAAAYAISNIYILNAVINGAIASGQLPWSYTGTLANPAGTAARYSDTVDGVLGALVSQGGYWNLTPSGVLTTPTGPSSSPSLMVFASDVPGGRTFDNYANVIIGTYLNSGASGAMAWVNTPGQTTDTARYGRYDKRIDLTGLGQMSTASAQAAVNAVLTRYAGGPAWTAPLTVQRGQVFTTGGATPDLATIPPGITVRVVALNPDTFGTGQSLTDIPIGQVDYDDTTGALQLTPLVSARDDMTSLLAKAGTR